MKAVRVWYTVSCMGICGLFLWATEVRASDIAFYIGSWPPRWYDERQFEDVDQVVAETDGVFISTAKFEDGGIDDFERWVKGNVSDGELDIIWLNGSMPRFLYPGDAGGVPLATRWVDSGNMFINVGHQFAFQSFECGGPCDENGDAGAAEILDLDPGIIVDVRQAQGGANIGFKKTPTGEAFLPRLPGRPVTARGLALREVVGDWRVAAIFGSNDGTEDEADFADPAVINNRKTGGYLAVINQAGFDLWNRRGEICSDFINNWVTANAVGFSVDVKGKLVTRWASIKWDAVGGSSIPVGR